MSFPPPSRPPRLFINPSRLGCVWETADDACCTQVRLKPRQRWGGRVAEVRACAAPAAQRRPNSGALSSIPVVLQTVAFVCEVTRARRDTAHFPAALGC